MSSVCTLSKRFVISLLFASCAIITAAQNSIVVENSLPGTPQDDWDIGGAGDLTIQGFATNISINKGQTVYFKIKTDASAYTIKIFRLGYYGGHGARLVDTADITTSLPQIQPDPLTDTSTGLVDCGNWSVSAHWHSPATAVSGLYFALLQRADNGGASHIPFIVRDDTSHSDILFQTSDATWQAYNVYGGNSLYVGTTAYPAGHAVKVSYNRPFITRNGGGGGNFEEDWFMNAEYPMIRFLERNGYNVTYFTNVDAARNGGLIMNHKAFLSVGHDEYWSKEQRDNVEAARNAGVHLAFFSGNEVYWKTRWENSAAGTPYRTLVCYKEGNSGENVCGAKCDPTAEWTGLWRAGCEHPSGNGCKPENGLTGQIGWQASTGSIGVPYLFKNLRFWRNTSIASLSYGQTATLPYGTLGYEWDQDRPGDDSLFSSYPAGRITLSSTILGGKVHKLSLYRHSSGALVFGAGTVQWSWGLDGTHDRGSEPPSLDMQQATVNLFADMGIQPATLMAGLVPATQSTDVSAPEVTILGPADGDSLPAFQPITITGKTMDDNVIVGVDISVDGGSTWKSLAGTTEWSYTFTPTAVGPLTVKVRSFDDSGNMTGTSTTPSSNAIVLQITAPVCPCTIFEVTDVPEQVNQYNNTGLELGTKFKAAINGYIRGFRFYKSSNDTGTHTGSLWTSGGTLLKRATSNAATETESGWQEIYFDSPVAITANTVYIISYHTPTGYFAKTNPYFTEAKVNGPLTALMDEDPASPNGLYKETSSPAFPDVNYQSDNYWVDVVFDANQQDLVAPKIISSTPANYATKVPINSTFTAVFNETVDDSTINSTSVQLRDVLNQLVPSTMEYDKGTRSLTITPQSPLNYYSIYKVIVKGGSTGIEDMSGNYPASDIVRTFSTQDETVLGANDGPGGPILVIHSNSNPFSLYSAEILRAEGLNEFTVAEQGTLSPALLNSHDVVILGEMTLSAPQVTMVADWVNAGGTLIAFRPSSSLNTLLGISAASGTLNDKYLLINTASGPGFGIVNQTIQFHGVADLHTLAGASSLATLYSNSTTATANPAVTVNSVGSNGGKAVAFMFDLPKSIILTRQGNPAWVGQDRDGIAPVRSNDLFYGNSANDPQPDWNDFDKIEIPQADEQQRFLANIILQYNLHRKPLPRFWYLPKGLKAAIVMTGDDHANNGTASRFDYYKTLAPNTAEDLANWNSVRMSSYIFPNTPLTNSQVANYQNDGFEIALHLNNGCTNFTEASLDSDFNTLVGYLQGSFPAMNPAVSHRAHCLLWSDWATMARVEATKGIRFDVNYYYWPAAWVQNRAGMFNGSGMPMRFAELDGSMIDVYQAATQITDESGLTVGPFTAALLDKALGPEGYYGAFVANMHTDTGATHVGSEAVIAEAMARQVPVVSSKQMLEWIDARNNSSFGDISWSGNILTFTITAGSGSNNIKAMLPTHSESGILSQITRAGSPISYTVSTIKGIEYAFFDATVTTSYAATYGEATTITGTVALQGRPAAPNAQMVVPVQVELYVAANPNPVQVFTTTTNTNGQFTLTSVPIGNFHIKVKSPHTLARVKLNQVLAAGGNNIDFGTLLEGDANNDNVVDLLDFGLLLLTYNKVLGDVGYDDRADLNEDDATDLLDFGMMLLNYNTDGEEIP